MGIIARLVDGQGIGEGERPGEDLSSGLLLWPSDIGHGCKI